MQKVFYSLKSVEKILKESKPSKVCVVTSRRLVKKFKWAFAETGLSKSRIILLPDGEKTKEWNQLEILLKKMSMLNLDRDSVLIALGGGTIGDSVGFAASIYLRGIRYIQIPTTLLAQVDSAHGGKTGINFLGYKNQIGSFYPAMATVIDTRFLSSLSQGQIVDGLGEIIKVGLIKDPGILSLLKKQHVRTFTKSPALLKIIKKSVAVKYYYANGDVEDNGLRQLLNVGHTFGHAIELKYKIPHGKAVIAGMLQELAYTESLNITHHSVRKNLTKLLSKLGITVEEAMNPDWRTILHDKKIRGKKITLPVIEKEGKAKLITLDTKTLNSPQMA